jgi:hypothetical protein
LLVCCCWFFSLCFVFCCYFFGCFCLFVCHWWIIAKLIICGLSFHVYTEAFSCIVLSCKNENVDPNHFWLLFLNTACLTEKQQMPIW